MKVNLQDFQLASGEPVQLNTGESVVGVAYEGLRLDMVEPGSSVRIKVRNYRGDNVEVEAIWMPRAERSTTLPDWLEGEVRKALEGESNDAEHDALEAVAEHFGVEYTPIDYLEPSPDPNWMNP